MSYKEAKKLVISSLCIDSYAKKQKQTTNNITTQHDKRKAMKMLVVNLVLYLWWTGATHVCQQHGELHAHDRLLHHAPQSLLVALQHLAQLALRHCVLHQHVALVAHVGQPRPTADLTLVGSFEHIFLWKMIRCYIWKFKKNLQIFW